MSNHFEKENSALWDLYTAVETTARHQSINVTGAVVEDPADPLVLSVFATHPKRGDVVTHLRPGSTVQSALASFSPVSAAPAPAPKG